MKKTIAAGLVALVVIVVGLATWWALGSHAPEVATNTIQYRNEKYGFQVVLPQTWVGYSIVEEKWVGTKIGTSTGPATIEGPKISIRHPGWTSGVPRQDIPVLIFTPSQWQQIAEPNSQYALGAAPIGPSQLGRNNTYILALPARYNFAYPIGFEEVDQILSGGNFSAFDQ